MFECAMVESSSPFALYHSQSLSVSSSGLYSARHLERACHMTNAASGSHPRARKIRRRSFSLSLLSTVPQRVND
jgi:hypothetical protein